MFSDLKDYRAFKLPNNEHKNHEGYKNFHLGTRERRNASKNETYIHTPQIYKQACFIGCSKNETIFLIPVAP